MAQKKDLIISQLKFANLCDWHVEEVDYIR